MASKLNARFAGAPRVWESTQEYQLNFVSFAKSGRVLLKFCRNDEVEKKHQDNITHFRNFHTDEMRVQPMDLKKDLLVLVHDKNSDTFFRAQLLTDLTGDDVMLLAVDTALIFKHKSDGMYYMPKKCWLMPYESNFFHLDNLDLFEGTNILKEAMKSQVALFSGNLTGTFVRLGIDKLPVVRIKTRDGIDISEAVLKVVYAACAVTFPKPNDHSKLAKISHYDLTEGYNAVFYLQFFDSFNDTLQEMIDAVRIDWLGPPLQLKDLNKNDVYIAPYEDCLYRAKVTKKPSESLQTAEVWFMDYGNKAIVPISSMRKAESISPHLNKIPPMCHKVVLRYIRKILQEDVFDEEVNKQEYFIVDVQKEPRQELPCVMLLKTAKNSDGKRNSFNKLLIRGAICKPGGEDMPKKT